MSRRSSAAKYRRECAFGLLLCFAFFSLLSPSCQDSLPRGARARLTAYPGSGYPGFSLSIAVGGIWSDDEQDACHSSPVNRKYDDLARFALLDSESPLKKGSQANPPPSFHPLLAALGLFRTAPEYPRSPQASGPSLPFPRAFPVFLISDLPPPFSA